MKIIDGKAHAQAIYEDLAKEVATMKYTPKLVIVQVANHAASAAYIRGKIAAATKVGIEIQHQTYDETMTQVALTQAIQELNADKTIDGIIVQLPLPDHLDELAIASLIDPQKDVDGFHPLNLGNLLLGEVAMQPCTPKGIIRLLEREEISLTGKHVVVVGRSNIVGKPIAFMALAHDATISIAHSRTKNLAHITRQADILIVAVGRAHFITSEMVKLGSVVIDVGINRVAGKLVGDVDFADVSEKVAAITPVPGGVGPMTVAMLMENTVASAKNKS